MRQPANFPGGQRVTFDLLSPLPRRRRAVRAAAAHPEAEEGPRALPIGVLPWELLQLAARERRAAPEA